MKIQDLEKELNITRSNIRFYEKEGLLNPPRKENGYRDYGDEEIARLKKIIIFRKLGITVADIKSIFEGTLPLQTAIDNNIDRLHKEIEELNGAIEVCQQIKEDNSEEKDFPQDHFWNVINNRENKGEKFNDILKDYLNEEIGLFTNVIEMIFFVNLKKIKEELGLIGAIIVFLLICAGCGIVNYLFVDDYNFISFVEGFIFPVKFFLSISLTFTPLYFLMRFLRKRYPKVAKILDSIFLICGAVFFIRYAYYFIKLFISLFASIFNLFVFLFETFYL